MNNKTKYSNWRDYTIHNEKEIKGFFGEERHLSNFHLCDVWFEGLLYPSSENAFMAAKSLDQDIRFKFSKTHAVDVLAPKDAKSLGQSIDLRPDWETIKYDQMLRVVFAKFSSNSDIKEKLLNTGSKYLEETNSWHDNCWGSCICERCKSINKQNNLGKILMKVRECLRK